jgi:hypothetical protein
MLDNKIETIIWKEDRWENSKRCWIEYNIFSQPIHKAVGCVRIMKIRHFLTLKTIHHSPKCKHLVLSRNFHSKMTMFAAVWRSTFFYPAI